MQTNDRLNQISEEGLCIGCGLCQSIAGQDRVAMAVTPEGHERPVIQGELEEAALQSILATCPGCRIEGLPEALIDGNTQTDNVWGPYQSIVMAHAADPEIRFKASTGGVMTALALYLLESGEVDFILQAKASDSHPSFGQRHLSFTRQDVLDAMGSRYGPTATLVDLAAVLDRGRPFAFFAKPCDMAALRNYARLDARVDQLCKMTVAMVCGGFMPPSGMDTFLRSIDIDPEAVTALRYRGYGCPGPTRVEIADGTVVEKNYLDFWGEDESAWSLPFRCKICPDAIGEAADIAAADSWPGGSPGWEEQKSDLGSNAVLLRSARGQALMKAAVEAGYMVIEHDLTARDMDNFQPHQMKKKFAAWGRLLGLDVAGSAAPQTERLRLAELAQEMGVAFNLLQARGTKRRVREGRAAEMTPVIRSTKEG